MPKRPIRLRPILATLAAIGFQLMTVAVAAACTGGGDFPRRLVERL
ncbi:MAG TPA: hypothetical protein VHK06_04210 [Candidatus Limnocylindria bacterium]|nr:hypothetical protein [Candidatus Limnocylindria bacterium]